MRDVSIGIRVVVDWLVSRDDKCGVWVLGLIGMSVAGGAFPSTLSTLPNCESHALAGIASEIRLIVYDRLVSTTAAIVEP